MLKFSPWMAARKKLLITISLDYILINILFKILNLDFSSIKILVTTNIFSISWILVSYVFGRYSEFQDFLITSIFRKIINVLFTVMLTGIIFKLFLISINYLYKNINLILILLLTATLSFFIEYIQSFIFNKFSSNKLKWISIYSLNSGKSKLANVSDIKRFGLIDSLNINDLILNLSNYDSNNYGFVIEDINQLSGEEKSLFIDLKNKGFKIYNIVYWTERFLQRYPADVIDNSTILNFLLKLSFKDNKYRIKRVGEAFLALFLILVTLPFILFFALIIKIEDNGPIFYKQRRCGFGGNIFTLYKLRTMKLDAEKDGIRWSSKNDKRVTKVGSFLRKMRIDEIPQLFSVIKGDMSLIGPRPERPEIDKMLISKISNYKLRYLVKPGISGWSQVNFPYGASIEDAKTKLSFDIFYIKNQSTIMDFLIMFKTIRLVLNLRGSKPL